MVAYGFGITTDEGFESVDTEKGHKLLLALKANGVLGVHPHFSGQFQIFLFSSEKQRDRALELVQRAGFETAEIVEEACEIDDIYGDNRF